MSLRHLKQKIREQEAHMRRATGNKEYKNMRYRRRFNKLAGGQAYGQFCTYSANEIPVTQRMEYWDEENNSSYFCQNDKAGVECVREIVTPDDRKHGISRGDVCAQTDASGNCPSKCVPKY